MREDNNKAFTLVELIVVITILAVLWTIAFISFQGYTINARDSVRKNDINSIMSSLEYFSLNTWFYPEPSNSNQISFSWAEVWTQWTIWDDLILRLGKISKKPVDPLTQSEYTYSRLNTKNEYQIAAIFESETAWIFLNQVNAWDKNGSAYIKWNFNWQVAKVSTWSITYILAVPSIITSDLTLELIDVVSQRKFVYNEYSNLPSSYDWSVYNIDWGFDFAPNKLVVYSSWDLDELNTDVDIQISFLKELQDSYSWTILEVAPDLKPIINIDIDTSTPSDNAKNLAWTIIKYNVREIKTIIYWYPTITSTSSWWPSNCAWITITWVTYPAITYTHPTLNHSDTLTWTWTNSISNWAETYTWDINCNDWTKSIASENMVTNCNTNYTWDWDSCEPGSQTFNCTAKPVTWTIWNSVSSYTQTWNWSSWAPVDSVTTYNTTSSTTSCNYDCNTGFSWDWDSCEAASVNYPWCSEPDITVSPYTIAACNVWVNTAATSPTDSNGYWELFQWWNKAPIKTASTSTTRYWATTDNSTFSNPVFIRKADWTDFSNDNLWWDNWWSWTDIQRKGPCADWYHVPSTVEWAWLRVAWWWSTANWWNTMSIALKLPRTWYRNTNDWVYKNGWNFWYYHSSSPNSWVWPIYTRAMVFSNTLISPNWNASRASGYAIRCFKD